ncbi:MAG: alpha-galactosidase [Lachnospiraceae bacterium]|nr:alpha-galactosidase [Lachnospiraceae bacterium]
MIENINDTLFHLRTENTSYVFTVYGDRLLHLHYGKKIDLCENGRNALLQKWANMNACSVEVDDAMGRYCPDDEKVEYAVQGTGDMRTPAIALQFADGGTTSEFIYESYEIMPSSEARALLTKNYLPHSYNESNDNALVITLKERTEKVSLKLFYFVYPECDVITRSAMLINEGDAKVIINKMDSFCLDLDADVIKVTSFHGDWAREMEKCDLIISGGKFVNESRTGNSSNHSNPFVMYAEPKATEEAGEVYATNLVYSGNHRESVEFGGHAKARILTGINPDLFSWGLNPGEDFVSPEAAITFSDKGYRGISLNMHEFVREHIVRGKWKKKDRPILLNSWEACYFGINESKLVKLAKEAKDCGMELFVTDDGWFGNRDSDDKALGDWFDNREKLPKGVGHLSEKIKELGLMFGIWVEPEMVNENSDLYRAHPDWALKNPNRRHYVARNQMILDFTKKEVQENIIGQMKDLFERSRCDYIKWDMNRHFSDYFSENVEPEKMGETAHAYILGVYRVMAELVKAYPDILFEGCASGGNRFDLGILCYFPQIWASDDTDAVARTRIQNGYSYGYPQSTWTAHVSAVPNHQTLRVTPLETRFAMASMGVFGYELNLCDLSSEEKNKIKEQVEFYKKWRHILQWGDFYRLGGKVLEESFEKYSGGFLSAKLDSTLTKNIIVSKDKKNAVGYMVNGLVNPNYAHTYFRLAGLDDDKTYFFRNSETKVDIRSLGSLINYISPIHIKQEGILHNIVAKFMKLDGEKEQYVVSGSLLNNAGIQLSQAYCGSGFAENTRKYADFDSRIYEITEVDDKSAEI